MDILERPSLALQACEPGSRRVGREVRSPDPALVVLEAGGMMLIDRAWQRQGRATVA